MAEAKVVTTMNFFLKSQISCRGLLLVRSRTHPPARSQKSLKPLVLVLSLVELLFLQPEER